MEYEQIWYSIPGFLAYEININTSIYDIKEVLNSYKIFADVEI